MLARWAADLQGLRTSAASWMGVSKPGSRWYASTPPELLGSIRPRTRPVTDLPAARFTEQRGLDRATQIDQELDALPFDPHSTIEVPSLPAPPNPSANSLPDRTATILSSFQQPPERWMGAGSSPP